ncbi:MAG: isoprenylcysteine carboxylmethyltransferase family protein [Alphaproteobacteria bacterium]
MSAELFVRRHLPDLVIRLALGLAFAIMAGICLRSGFAELQKIDFDDPRPYQISQILSIFTVTLYTLIIACLYVLRLRPISHFAGYIPSAAALLGAFLLSALLLLSPREDLPVWVLVFADLLVVTGNIFASVILLRLGRSFSILPESRRLVTHGPYAVVRHPLYLAEAVATIGIAIIYWSPWAMFLVAAQFAFQIVRIHYEEKILKKHFPEYEAYARKTRRLIPGVY